MMRVAAGVILRGREVLVCQRPAHAAHPLKWEFPGGKCEPGESVAQCLRRELQEELHVAAEVGRELWRGRYQYGTRDPFELCFLLVTRYHGALSVAQFAAARWMPVDSLSGLDWLDADRDFIGRLERGEINWAD